MAKGHSGGPGTYRSNGVQCTMDPPFDKSAKSKTGTGAGIDGHNRAPFDKPQDTGNGGIPTRFFDEGMGKATAKGLGTVAGQVSPPKSSGNVGKRRY